MSLSAGAEVEGEESDGGIAGSRMGLCKGRWSCCFRARTEAADVAASSGYMRFLYRILMLSQEICGFTTCYDDEVDSKVEVALVRYHVLSHETMK